MHTCIYIVHSSKLVGNIVTANQFYFKMCGILFVSLNVLFKFVKSIYKRKTIRLCFQLNKIENNLIIKNSERGRDRETKSHSKIQLGTGSFLCKHNRVYRSEQAFEKRNE